MDFRQIVLVQESWSKLTDRLDTLGTLFYWRLFELDGSLRPLFKQDIHRQQQKFTHSINYIVANLGQPQQFFYSTKLLGQHHARIGVHSEHYHTVAQAFLWALQELLGKQFTPEHHQAWETAYYLIAGLMKEAAENATPDESPIIVRQAVLYP
ncbi:MAG: hemin receptor [Chloroflexi bacterium]|nr:hemin receptor [Chloroflexota bacterium]